MTTSPKPDQEALTRLADALCEDVINTPGEKLLAEVAEDHGHQSAFAKEFDEIFERTVQSTGHQNILNRIGALISELVAFRPLDALKTSVSKGRFSLDGGNRIKAFKAPASRIRTLPSPQWLQRMLGDRRAWAAAAAAIVLIVATPVYLINRSVSPEVGPLVSSLDQQHGDSREDGPSVRTDADNSNVQVADNSAAENKSVGETSAKPAAPAAAPLRPVQAAKPGDNKRVALVIGNSSYQNAPALQLPAKDATLIAGRLKEAGFGIVEVKNNLGQLPFKRALQDFQVKAENAEIALIYFAGYGIQARNQNYFVPVDAVLRTETAVEDEAVTLDRMVQAIEPAKKLKLIIIDASRDNPFEKNMRRRVANRVAPQGLGKEEPQTTDTLIAYATRPGATIDDAAGPNSPFALALARHLVEPGLDIRFAFGRIRDEVIKATDNRQEPFVAGSIGGDQISLNPTVADPSTGGAAVVADANFQKQDYELATKVGSRRAFEIFIAQYKTGMYVEFAREQIKKLDPAQQVASLAPAATVPQPSREPSAAERQAWDRVKDKSNKDDLHAFITAYPNSALRLTAERQLEAIEEREAKLREERAVAEARLRAENERQRLAALQKVEDERRAKATADERARMDRACQDQEDRLANLESAGNKPWARDDLNRLERELNCERLRPRVVAALGAFDEKPAVNTPDLVRSAQIELARIGCYTGAINGSLPGTRTAANNYLSRSNKPMQRDLDITEDFVASLGKERRRVCPLVCGADQEAVGERCVASRPPAKKEEAKRPVTAKAREKSERPAQASRPAPAKSAGGGGGMTGVGF